MNDNPELYRTPNTMYPLVPEDASGILEKLAIELIEKASRLSGTLNPITRSAIGDFLRPMNSYYSNLIEGHDTHPIDIEKALNKKFSNNKEKRELQLEAKAHIEVHKKITEEIIPGSSEIIPASSNYLQLIHKRFYDYLPEELKKAKSVDGVITDVVPGKFRETEVIVGRHIAPASDTLNLFTERFEEVYSPKNEVNKSKVNRVISIAASHHRLAWIHPFLDGNGRVVRLFSDACFMYENLHASGLWSISRGLARANDDYKANLANADLQRYNDYDGKGNLSNKMLFEFCKFFLEIAIDQLDYMYQVMDTEKMLERIESFGDLMTSRNVLRPGAKYILINVFLKGKISKAEAMRITETSDKTLKSVVDSLVEMGLIEPKKEGKSMMYYAKYPITSSPMLFPGLYPMAKEIDMKKLSSGMN